MNTLGLLLPSSRQGCGVGEGESRETGSLAGKRRSPHWAPGGRTLGWAPPTDDTPVGAGVQGLAAGEEAACPDTTLGRDEPCPVHGQSAEEAGLSPVLNGMCQKVTLLQTGLLLQGLRAWSQQVCSRCLLRSSPLEFKISEQVSVYSINRRKHSHARCPQRPRGAPSVFTTVHGHGPPCPVTSAWTVVVAGGGFAGLEGGTFAKTLTRP